MTHSNLKERSHENSTGVGCCTCGQTFDYSSHSLGYILDIVRIHPKELIK